MGKFDFAILSLPFTISNLCALQCRSQESKLRRHKCFCKYSRVPNISLALLFNFRFFFPPTHFFSSNKPKKYLLHFFLFHLEQHYYKAPIAQKLVQLARIVRHLLHAMLFVQADTFLGDGSSLLKERALGNYKNSSHLLTCLFRPTLIFRTLEQI